MEIKKSKIADPLARYTNNNVNDFIVNTLPPYLVDEMMCCT